MCSQAGFVAPFVDHFRPSLKHTKRIKCQSKLA
jgi:hypothetical protein